ncbi:MAG: hypothetical protein QNJ11_16755 [Woeseiaceae bacterium]|nr:hypothetical protein [Woeseiaceae bacterium]
MGIFAKLTGKVAARKPPASTTGPTSRYRGVQIVTLETGCCRAARDLVGQRFLCDEIPRLPLEACDAQHCQCIYELFNDRRTDTRRLSDFGYDIVGELRIDENQRTGPADRRGQPVDETALLSRIASAFR